MIINEIHTSSSKLTNIVKKIGQYARVEFIPYGYYGNTYIYDIIGINTSQDYQRVKNIIENEVSSRSYHYKFGFKNGTVNSKSDYQLVIVEL